MNVAVNGWFLGQATTGSGQYLHHLLAYLPQRFPDLELSVYVPRGQWAAPQSQIPDAVDMPGAGQVRIIPCALPSLPPSLAKLWWEQVTFPRAARRAQILWVPYWAAPLWQPRPTVVTVHDLIPLLLPAYRGGLLKRLYTRLVSHTARRAALILTVSHAAAQDIHRHLQIPRARIQVVHHGPNHAPGDHFGPGQSALAEADPEAEQLQQVRARYALPPHYFLYLGGFDVRKNVTAIIQAYARYLARAGDPSIHLVIGGALPEPPTPLTPDPRPTVQELGLHAQVHFCGFVEDAHKPLLYRMAHAYIFPSLYEGFGMMLLEAMAAGAPVITSGPPTPPNER